MRLIDVGAHNQEQDIFDTSSSSTKNNLIQVVVKLLTGNITENKTHRQRSLLVSYYATSGSSSSKGSLVEAPHDSEKNHRIS